MAFPPNLLNIEHVVINSTAQEELALRTGITSIDIQYSIFCGSLFDHTKFHMSTAAGLKSLSA